MMTNDELENGLHRVLAACLTEIDGLRRSLIELEERVTSLEPMSEDEIERQLPDLLESWASGPGSDDGDCRGLSN